MLQASASLDALLGQQRGSSLPDDLCDASTCDREAATAADLPTTSLEAIWLRYVTRLTQITAQHLPDLWLMSSEQLTTLATVSDRAKQLVDASVTLVATSLRALLDRYRFAPSGHIVHLLTLHEVIGGSAD